METKSYHIENLGCANCAAKMEDKMNKLVGVEATLTFATRQLRLTAEDPDSLLPMLTEEEEAVFKRGRNAHSVRTGADYHRATGLEALFGYLYLAGRSERIRELFARCMENE